MKRTTTTVACLVLAVGTYAQESRTSNEIAANGPLSVQAILRALRETEGLSEIEGLKLELAIGQPIFATEDVSEQNQRAFYSRWAELMDAR